MRRFAADPSPELGSYLLLQLLVLRQRIDEGRRDLDLFRAGASLGQMYGLLLGNDGKFSTAHNWYRTATVLADRSKDTALRSFVRGRSLNRGLYEGYTAKQTLDGADEILSLAHSPNAGVLEAHAVRVCVHALTNNVREGRLAIADMRDTVEHLPDSDSTASLGTPLERTAFHNAYLESRVGSLDGAQRACEDALKMLGNWPLWIAETKMYLARALVMAGDVKEGITYGLATAQSMRHDVHVIGIAVRDVTTTVPEGYSSDELKALQAYASKVAGPWEALR